MAKSDGLTLELQSLPGGPRLHTVRRSEGLLDWVVRLQDGDPFFVSCRLS